jgi:hypothetical protein
VSDAMVYSFRWEDLERFQSLAYDLADAPREMTRFNGVAKSDWWQPPPVYAELPRLERPDFWPSGDAPDS